MRLAHIFAIVAVAGALAACAGDAPPPAQAPATDSAAVNKPADPAAPAAPATPPPAAPAK